MMTCPWVVIQRNINKSGLKELTAGSDKSILNASPCRQLPPSIQRGDVYPLRHKAYYIRVKTHHQYKYEIIIIININVNMSIMLAFLLFNNNTTTIIVFLFLYIYGWQYQPKHNTKTIIVFFFLYIYGCQYQPKHLHSHSGKHEQKNEKRYQLPDVMTVKSTLRCHGDQE